LSEEEERQNFCDGHEDRGHLTWEKLAYYSGRNLCSSCRAGLQHDYRESHKDHRKRVSQLNEDVTRFASQEGIGVKCMSDRILLYCRYSVSTLAHQMSEENRRRLLDMCDRICQSARGDMDITNKNPRTVASAVVYIAAVVSGTRMTQHQVAVSLDVTDKTIRDNYLFLKARLRL
jgi:hypothetical protein